MFCFFLGGYGGGRGGYGDDFDSGELLQKYYFQNVYEVTWTAHVDVFWVNIFAPKHNNCVMSLDGQYVYMHILVRLQP